MSAEPEIVVVKVTKTTEKKPRAKSTKSANKTAHTPFDQKTIARFVKRALTRSVYASLDDADNSLFKSSFDATYETLATFDAPGMVKKVSKFTLSPALVELISILLMQMVQQFALTKFDDNARITIADYVELSIASSVENYTSFIHDAVKYQISSLQMTAREIDLDITKTKESTNTKGMFGCAVIHWLSKGVNGIVQQYVSSEVRDLALNFLKITGKHIANSIVFNKRPLSEGFIIEYLVDSGIDESTLTDLLAKKIVKEPRTAKKPRAPKQASANASSSNDPADTSAVANKFANTNPFDETDVGSGSDNDSQDDDQV